jgi:hypothetical protein
VRPWQQKKSGGDPTVTALPGVWREKSVTIGQAVVGRVTDHAGLGLSGVTVSVSGTSTSTVSTNNGNYQLATGSDGTFAVKADDFNGLVAPPATAVSTTQDTPGVLNITLRPVGTGQIIANNDFESDLSNWSTTGPASVTGAEQHTGNSSLLLAGGATASQSGPATDMRFPLLSFWYKSEAGTTMTVEIWDGGGPLKTQSLAAAGDWTFVTIESGLGQSYSGPVGVRFSQSGSGNVYIDEVSIAAGPLKTYLPLIFKN